MNNFNHHVLDFKNKHNQGFSLLEMAVVLGIVGVLAAGSVAMFSEQNRHVMWQEGQTRLDLVKSSLLNFAKLNKYLPCPDVDDDGFEDRGLGGLVCQSSQGSIPYNSLNITLASVQDSWGNNLTYKISSSATDAGAITDCPQNSACFFNNSAPPQFDLTTLPIMGETEINNMSGSTAGGGANNIRVCNVLPCDMGTADQNIIGDSLIAVVVSHNDDNAGNLDPAEQVNSDNTSFFVKSIYSEQEGAHFDDLLITISGNELKDRFETEVIELSNGGGGGPPNNPFEDLTLPVAGGNGDNDRFASNIGLNIESGVIDFGTENAGRTVTFSFDAKVTGGWEDADALNEGVAAQVSRGRLETQDKFVVGLNANVDSRLYDVADGQDVGYGAGLVDVEQGLDWMGVDPDSQSERYFYYDENDDSDNTWYEYASYNTVLDENGRLKVDFAVFSTHVSEMVELSNIEAVMYNAPTTIPTMPSVGYIEGKKFDQIIEDGNLN